MARLEQDPEFVKRRAEREQAHAAGVARLREALEPVMDDLRHVGVFVEEWNDVITRYCPLSPSVVERLLSWLPRLEDPDALEVIVRALAAAPTVRFDGGELTRLFETTECESLRWAIANTLSCTQPEGVEAWVVRAVQNPAYGKGREMLAIALARLLPSTLANPVLVSLLEDLPIHAASGLALSGTPNEVTFL
jgi:hypothetical protein